MSPILSISFDYRDYFTISLIITSHLVTGYQPLFDFHPGTASSNYFTLRHSAPSTLHFISENKGADSGSVSASSYSAGDWLSVCLTSAPDTWKLYQDGNLLSSGSYAQSSSATLGASGVLIFGKEVLSEQHSSKFS